MDLDQKVTELNNRIKELESKLSGKCPDCNREIKGWKPVFGPFAPEWWASCREMGVDPASGHSMTCRNKSLKL